MKGVLLNIVLSILLSSLCLNTYAQTAKHNPFQMVSVPDSIYYKLEDAYKQATGFDSVNAGRNVCNLLNGRDFKFKNSIYSYKGQGPHFPRLIFIFHDGQLYTFKSSGAHDPKGIIEEYVKCIEQLRLSDTDIRNYLMAISRYLEQEKGQTYGYKTR